MSKIKNKETYICTSCGAATGKWAGCCLSCNAWGTLEKQTEQASGVTTSPSTPLQTTQLADIQESETIRLTSNIPEFDRVMGGGLVPGSFIILTGDPGIGKSTLLLQVAHAIATQHTVIYCSSEESLTQIKQRAKRLLGNTQSTILFAHSTALSSIIAAAQESKPALLIIDSIQNCHLHEQTSKSLPGSVSQLKEAGFSLLELAKKNNITIIATGHITKEGHMAGPKVLEHIVDSVFYLQSEDRWHMRILRAVKNRFGATDEVGFFHMNSDGLQTVADINELTVGHLTHAPGTALTCSMEGSRPLLIEMQALTISSKLAMPQRVITGVDHKKLLLIAAILEKYLKIPFSSCDIFFNVSNGAKIRESAGDCAIALALLSSYFQTAVPAQSLALGEISLTGHIQPVSYFTQRAREAARFGITTVYTATRQTTNEAKNSEANWQQVPFSQVYQLLTLFPEE